MKLTRATDYPSPIDMACALCGIQFNSLEQSGTICQEMDFDDKSCPHCYRTYGEARREEDLLYWLWLTR